MLIELRIRNVAVIESVSLPLGTGFNVLTGETGAGKSIVVGSLALLLGERGDAGVVRTGEAKATVEGVFDIQGRDDLAAALDARGIDVDDATLVLKREVQSTGRTRAWINGSPVTATALAEVGRSLVDIHGQHEAQSLLDAGSQRETLDAFADAAADARKVAEAHAALADVRARLADLAARRTDIEKRADYLRHVVNELDAARLVEGEDVRLEEDARRLENAAEIRSEVGALLAALQGEEGGALERLSDASRVLHHLEKLDPSTSKFGESLDAAYYAIETLAREAESYAADIELDPASLARARERRDLLFRLLKKYGPGITDALATASNARAELSLLDSASIDTDELRRLESDAAVELERRAKSLSAKRRDAAERLEREVEALLPELGMPDGKFVAELVPRAEIGSHGAEDVAFRVSLNAGQDLRPLARVASGGELSRIMLALKTILARLDRVPTLIFDEVDAGIGGVVGQQVGDLLRKVAGARQVLVVTHLPQIAARAHHHVVVSKGSSDGVTTADVRVAERAERVVEVARMLGGDAESATSRAHAAELLDGGSAERSRGRTRKADQRPRTR